LDDIPFLVVESLNNFVSIIMINDVYIIC